MKKIEEKIDMYLKEGVFDEPEPQEFSAGDQKLYPPVASSVPGTYDPTRDAGSITQGLKRLKYYLTMANTPAKFAKAMSLAHELVTKFPNNQRIAQVINVIKTTPIRILKTVGDGNE